MSADPTERPIHPSKPSAAASPQPTTTVTPEKNAQLQPTETKKRLMNTGSAIAGIAVFAIIIAVAGAVVLRPVKRRRG